MKKVLFKGFEHLLEYFGTIILVPLVMVVPVVPFILAVEHHLAWALLYLPLIILLAYDSGRGQ